MKLIVLTLLLFSINFSFAYTIASLGQNKVNAPTHVLVVGEGKELGTLFLRSALSRVNKLKEVFPNENTLILWAKEWDQYSDKKFLQDRGYQIIESSSSYLNNSILMSNLLKISQIKSFHLFSHTAAFYGSKIQNNSSRFGRLTAGISRLKNKFTKDAYGYIYGCNSGFYEAPELSRIWNIPVVGSLTATDFQQLHNNNKFYHNNPGQYPSGGWKSYNNLSYSKSVSCYRGGCVRMKPDVFPYVGQHGKYKAATAYYKMFCNLSEGSSFTNRCKKAFYNQLITYPTIVNQGLYSSRSTYKKAVMDFVCPGDNNSRVKRECIEVMNKADRLKQWFPISMLTWGKSIDCNFKTCYFNLENSYNSNGEKIKIFAAVGNEVYSTASKEFNYYMNAFDTK